MCGAGGDASCDAGLDGAPGALKLSIGTGAHGCVLCSGDAGGVLPVVVCCVSCFVHACRYLQCACSVVPSFVQVVFCATSDPLDVSKSRCKQISASCALCLMLHCTAPLDVSKSLTQIAQQYHHENLSQHTSQCHCSIYETPCHDTEAKRNSNTASRLAAKHHDQQTSSCLLYTSPSPRD